jgi:hypothetical protein
MVDWNSMTPEEIQYELDTMDRVEAEVANENRRNAFNAFTSRPNRS